MASYIHRISDSKYIPYDLFVDFKETLPLVDFLNNRVTWYTFMDSLSSSVISETHRGLENQIFNDLMGSMDILHGRWTVKISMIDNYLRSDLMFEYVEDLIHFKTYILLADKLSG